jgi:hypothetical protein
MSSKEIDNVFDKDGGRLLALYVIALGMSEPKEVGECDRDRRLA